jgi:pimeloyl-ACP methyl ester carboxylesterase
MEKTSIGGIFCLFFMNEAKRDESIELAQEKAQFSIGDIAPEKAAPSIRVPVLLLHGMQDSYIPMSHTERLKQAIQSPHKLVRLDGVGHVDILLHDEAWKLIVAFLLHPERVAQN